MTSLMLMPIAVLTALVNHLWQSTLFAIAIGGLALLLRRNSARLRYWLWLIASLKFLVPFSLLAALGTQIPWQPVAAEAAAVAPRALDVAGNLAAPLAIDVFPQWPTAPEGHYWTWVSLAMVLFYAWGAGVLFLTGRWLWRWLEIRRALRKSVAMTGIDFPAPVRATEMRLEPGVVGIFRPVLVLPAGIETRLTPEQMNAVLAHERCHLRWHDNLTAALHMLVEMVFWFFPLVWWIGARLIAERERDCDEQVIRDGHASESYAEGILAVCEHYIASRLACVSGVSGSDLRKRIESILKRTLAVKLDRPKKFMLAALACCAVAVPIAAGAVAGNPLNVFLSSYVAGIFDYSRMVSTNMEEWNAAVSAANYSAATCPAPSPRIVQMQKSLAATVARLRASDGERVLLLAVAANSNADVQRLLATGASRKGDGFLRENSLMHIAARYGDEQTLETLANAGIGIDTWSGPMGMEGRRPATETPLIVAITGGRLDNARWFIRHGADVNATNDAGPAYKDGSMALARALALCGDRELVAQLLAAGARPNANMIKVAERRGIDLGTSPVQAATAPALTATPRADSGTRAYSTPTAPPKPAVAATGSAAFSAVAPAVNPPLTEDDLRRSWQRPTDTDLDRDAWRKESPTRYTEVKADFDGDGKEDHALLLSAVGGWMEGLFVKLSSQSPDKWIPAVRTYHSAASPFLTMGISMAKPGTYVTACGKGYGKCSADAPRELNLKWPAIEYFQSESASSAVYWDEASLRFTQVWVSD